jgi:hypothetical protein
LENITYFERQEATLKQKIHPEQKLVGASIKENSTMQTKLLVANSINNETSQLEKDSRSFRQASMIL